jgi:hypothetical protein
VVVVVFLDGIKGMNPPLAFAVVVTAEVLISLDVYTLLVVVLTRPGKIPDPRVTYVSH